MSGSAPKDRKELRRFGLTLAAALALVGGLLLWREKEAGPYLLAVSALALLFAAFFPTLLRALERLLAGVARVITAALTFVVLTLSFFLVITPIGLVLRLFRKNLLGLKPTRGQPTCWVSVEPDGPASRPDKPY